MAVKAISVRMLKGLAVAPLLLALSSCGPAQDSVGIRPQAQAPSESPTEAPPPVFPIPEPQEEGQFPIYRDPPLRLTAGRYASPLDTVAENQAGVQAELEDNGKPKFQGWIQGVYLGSDLPKEVKGFPCDRSDLGEIGNPEDEQQLRKSAYWFDPPSYLPAGTFDWTYPFGQTCGSEPAFDLWREFLVDGGGEISIYRTWRHFFPENFSQDRVSEGTIGGLPAVIVSPLTPEGAGSAHIIVKEKSGGTIRVSGFGLPLSEVEKIIAALVADVS